MTSPHDKRNLKPLSPRELLTGELPAVLSLWASAPSPYAARAIFSLWAGLRRLDVSGPDPDEDCINSLINTDTARQVDTAFRESLINVNDRLRRAKDLDRAWDEGEEDPQELDWQAHELFECLDRASLAVWAVEQLAGSRMDAEWLAASRESLWQAQEFLAARVDLFLCLATDVAAVLSSVRPGLADDEPGLWETLLKHRRIEEARDELETPPDRIALLASARLRPVVPVSASESRGREAADVQFEMAAGGPESSALLDRLAAESPAEPVDYRRAWAHFLAACYAQTPAAGAWLKAFLAAAAAAGPLNPDWKERVDSVRGLAKQRDWPRRYANDKVFSLEPRSPHTAEELLLWLRELVGPTSPG